MSVSFLVSSRARTMESVEVKVERLLKAEGRLTRNCFLKKLGFKPNIAQLVRDGVIRFVDNKFELVKKH